MEATISAKQIIGGVLFVAGIVLAIPTMGASLGLSAMAASIISAGLLITSSMLLGPSVPKMPASLGNMGRERLQISLDVRAPRKWCFGIINGATDVRYQTFTGANQEYMEMIVCVASHKVNSIYELWLDNELAWSSAGGVIGDFVGYLTVATRTEGTSANGIAIDSIWTSTATLTGCAYLHLKFKLTGPDDQTPGPFSSGVTSRMTIRCKGAYTYDPRLDSTVTGGSGSHRADNQATWTWSDTASRNPALQLLWYLLGWRINSKLALGMGIPKARIDLGSFITAANVCDESVTKNGGGTEPRYRSDGVLSEGDDRLAVVEALCVSMNAILRDNGGKLSLHVLKNDLASPAASFTEADIIGTCEWDQTGDLSSTFNITRGQRTDPSDNALYQPTEYAEVKIASVDGIDRIDTFDLPLVQSNGQAQRLAKQRLQRAQYQGRLAFVGRPAWWQVSLGEVIQLSHQSFGWANKLFRVAGQQISRNGRTETMLIEEHSDIYQWDNNESPAVTAGSPTVYDPNNSPILKGIVGAAAPTTGNMLTDVLFGPKWTLTAGASRAAADALSGYALGFEKFYLQLSPSNSQERSGLSELVPITPGYRYYFRARAQRGTSLGSGSKLNFGGRWIASNGTTVVAAAAEGAQQSPTSLTAGTIPKDIFWSDVAPSGAAYFQMKVYTPALSSSSGTFRVEGPWVGATPIGGELSISGGPESSIYKYSYDGVAESGQFPRNLIYDLYIGGVLQTSGVTWTYLVLTGSLNGFTNSSGSKAMTGTGSGTLAVSSLGTDSATVEITATVAQGVARITTTHKREYAAAPTSGGGGGGGGSTTLVSKTSGFISIFNSTFADITGTLTGTTPAGVTAVNVTVQLEASPADGSTGASNVEMKVQRNVGGTWTDIGSVRSATSEYDSGAGPLVNASFSFTQADTGLTASTAYNWRIVARVFSFERTHHITGSVFVTT